MRYLHFSLASVILSPRITKCLKSLQEPCPVLECHPRCGLRLFWPTFAVTPSSSDSSPGSCTFSHRKKRHVLVQSQHQNFCRQFAWQHGKLACQNHYQCLGRSSLVPLTCYTLQWSMVNRWQFSTDWHLLWSWFPRFRTQSEASIERPITTGKIKYEHADLFVID